MYGFVYIWRDRKHKRFYIGSHWGDVDDGYICSSSWMTRSYKRRPTDFKRRILSVITTSKQDLLLEEYKWLSLIKDSELRVKYYNINIRLQDHWWADDKKITNIRQKISDNKKKYWNSPESDDNRKFLSELNKSKGIVPPSRKGKAPWNKGLKKESDSRVLANALAISKPKSNTEKMGRYNRNEKKRK